jgi:predicted nucleotidyltransferase
VRSGFSDAYYAFFNPTDPQPTGSGPVAALGARHRVSRIVAGCGPIAAGTFGSYAVGLARDSSDLDLFVIRRTTLPTSARRRSMYRQLFGVMHPLDIHVFTPDRV